MQVLGIDPGLTRTGYGLLERGNPPLLATSGVIITDPKEPMADRLDHLWGQFEELLERETPSVMALESTFANRNLQTALGVIRASGVLLATAARAGIPVVEYPPTTVKSAVTGDGRATKTMIGTMVQRRLRLNQLPKPADTVDAIAVALCHLQNRKIKVASRT